jgi:hypothetical protein
MNCSTTHEVVLVLNAWLDLTPCKLEELAYVLNPGCGHADACSNCSSMQLQT